MELTERYMAVAKAATATSQPVKDEENFLTDFAITDCEEANKELGIAIKKVRSQPGWKSSDPYLVELKSHRKKVVQALNDIKQGKVTSSGELTAVDIIVRLALRCIVQNSPN